jgi:methanol--5-hydroxybenzimidazolylcobamide Co-methyltransferase
MIETFERGMAAGADLVAIESTGGKEVFDEALMIGNLSNMVFALGVLACRDMELLWKRIVPLAQSGGAIATGDTACGFGNTAMVLAERRMIPRVLAAIIRVATVPRSLIAYEAGATGPSKDCAYEGPYLKVIRGIPISMEGKSAACAHLSPLGNIAQAACDLWSNESVQNVRLLSANAPVVCVEQLVYDCRLLNSASERGPDAARLLRDLLVDSDSALDPQAFVLRPDVVVDLSAKIHSQATPYARTVTAVRETAHRLAQAQQDGEIRLSPREFLWLEKLRAQADRLPDREEALLASLDWQSIRSRCRTEAYGLEPVAGQRA